MKVNEIITKTIIDSLEKNVIPWRMTWSVDFPKNAITKREYSGINLLLLALLGRDEFFLTYKQAQELGGNVKAGCKAIQICFTKHVEKLKENSQGEKIDEGYNFLRYYNVFNLCDCENVKIKLPEKNKFVPSARAEGLINRFEEKNHTISYAGNSAYCNKEGKITLPRRDKFDNVESFYSTAFHEIGHALHLESGDIWTEESFKRASEHYSKEELIAEMFSCFVMNYCQLETKDTLENSQAYVKSWISIFKNNPSFVISAASKAQKRFNALLGVNQNNEMEN